MTSWGNRLFEEADHRAGCLVERLKQSRPLPTKAAQTWLPWALLGVLVLASTAVAFWAGRETVFRGDDWDLLLYRGGFNWDVFLVPHNEHLSALLIAAFKAIPAVAGPHYAAFRAGLLALDAAVAVLFFVFARERVGDWLALLATAPLLLMGAGSDNLLWPTQIGVVGSLACGIAVLILLDRKSLAARAGACALLTASIWSFSDGLFFLACAGIWLVLSRSRWRDVWIVVVPALTYIAWYAGHGTSDTSQDNLRAAPHFIAESAAAGVSALTGIGYSSSHPKAVGLVGGLALLAALAAFAFKVRPRVTPRIVALVSLPILSWAIIALGRAADGDPYASRYVYASAVFISMAVLEVVRGDYVRRLFRGWRIALVALAVGFSIFFNVTLLFDAGDYSRFVSQHIRGRTAAIELTRRTVDPNLPLKPLPDMAHMTAGWFLNAVEKYGQSPTGRVDLAGLNEQGRSAGDQVLAAAAPARFVRPPAGSGPAGAAPALDATSARLRRQGSCLIASSATTASVEVPPSGILIVPSDGQTVRILLRRFSSDFVDAPGQTKDSPTLLVIAKDRSSVPWHAQISSKAPVSICGASAPRRLRRGPTRPASGNQHCAPMSLGEDECRFSRH